MRPIRTAIVGAVALALALPVSTPAAAAPVPQARSVTAATNQVLASGLSVPWGIAALPDGSALVTERDTGKIWQVKPGTPAKVVYTVTEARPSGEGGLLGIAVTPNFPRTKVVFIYFTTVTDNRVARFVFGSSARPTPIVTGIPKGSIHNGGGLLWKEGSGLFIGTGDSGNRDLAQNNASLGGKVLRVTSTGQPVAANRWGRILTKGHRNVQDITMDPQGNKLWATELGQDSQDELNRLVTGGNYGWPICEGRCSVAGLRQPAWTWTPAEASPSGITWVHTPAGDRFYVGALRGQRVWKFTISPSTGTVSGMTPLLVGTYGRIRGVQGRGDGSLWIMTSNGGGTDRIIRISPAP